MSSHASVGLAVERSVLASLLLASALPALELRERWSLPLEHGSASGTSPHTVVVGSRAYYTETFRSRLQAFACVDLQTGRRLWRRSTPSSFEGTLVANGRHVVGVAEKDLIELDPRDGHTLWTARRQGFQAGTLLAGDRLVYAPRPRTLAAVDLTKRKEVWRKTFPIGLMAGYGHALADRGTAVFPGNDGSVLGVSVADGRTVWRRAAGQGDNLYLKPMGEATLVVGNGLVAYRTSDGKELWRRKDKPGWDMTYLPRRRELWAVGLDGRLGRLSAATGKTLSLDSLTGETGDALDVAKPYQDGFLLAKRETLLRLDDRGKAAAAFDPQETVFDLFPMGSDVVLRTETRFVRLTPGRPQEPKDLGKLLAKPLLTPEERRSVIVLGRKAVPSVITAAKKATGKRREELLGLLAKTAGREDTAAVLDFAESQGAFRTSPDRSLGPVYGWLAEKADPDALALALLSKFQRESAQDVRGRYLGYLLRSTAKPVVDELLALLHDPATPGDFMGPLYGLIGASGREDVLKTLLAIRAQGRRLETPIEGFSATRDTDGDGLPDAVDANPLVAPRALNDREKAMAAAFDAFFRFDSMKPRLGLVDYGPGVKPFELPGWSGGLVPRERFKETGLPEKVAGKRFSPYAFLDFQSHGGNVPTVQGGADGRTATVDLGVHYGEASGWGVRVTLRKFGDEWFSVDIRPAWIT